MGQRKRREREEEMRLMLKEGRNMYDGINGKTDDKTKSIKKGKKNISKSGKLKSEGNKFQDAGNNFAINGVNLAHGLASSNSPFLQTATSVFPQLDPQMQTQI